MADEPPATAATTTHILSVAKPLEPYIKSRQETLHIRQVLTSYLRSHIAFAEEAPDRPNPYAESHLALCAPQDAVEDVERIPLEVSGLRKEYLEALQANVAARNVYESISEDVTARTHLKKQSRGETAASSPNSELQTYLTLLHDRRQSAKLQVFQHYLQQLKTRRATESVQYDKTEEQNRHLQRIDDLEDGGQNGSGPEDGVEGLVHKLERAVIRARAQLDRERKLFEELKAQHDAEDKRHIPYIMNVQALKRTRDTLVQWVEEKLMSVGANDDHVTEELSPEEIEDAAALLEERKTQIMQQYMVYVEARRALLESAAKACQPVAAGPAQQRQASVDNEKPASEEESPSLDPMDVLAYASELLLPLSKSQRALVLQRSYLSGILSKEKSTTLRMLNRLGDESHLLPEYPILARQPRFKHAAAAINSRHSITPKEQNPPDEITSLAEAWSFAAGSAREQEHEYVTEKVVEGGETAQEALQTLEGICNTVNQDLEEIFPDERSAESSAPDFWASETQSRTKSSRVEKRPKGPWSGLNGRVGVAE